MDRIFAYFDAHPWVPIGTLVALVILGVLRWIGSRKE